MGLETPSYGNWGNEGGWPAPEIQRRSVESAHSEWQERSRSTIVANGEYYGHLQIWLKRLEKGLGQIHGWQRRYGGEKNSCPAATTIATFTVTTLKEIQGQRARISRTILPRMARTPPDTEIAVNKICRARTDLALEAHEVWDEKLRQGQNEYLVSHQAFRARQRVVLQILEGKREDLDPSCVKERDNLQKAWSLATESDQNIIETLDTALSELGVRYDRMVELLKKECPLAG
jgi:hypothetical protein